MRKTAAVLFVCILCLHVNSNAQQDHAAASQSASEQLTAANKLFIDLPGSYGGRLYYDEPAAAEMMQNRVLIDTVKSGQQTFCREYWAVYAGMGMWEGVINCYTIQGGCYYITSLAQQVLAGNPGDDAGGASLTSAELKAKVVASLRDTNNAAVARFTTMLNTVQINK